ncbi:hypothetical protein MKW98_001861 [Papaver atlanticum]|uniref:Pentatricopeptide repeat-containing protein n=1 Tax=Papaver atlanticum TaxID=357466 RepID=A0AAD4T5T5_9MAGN|nr:hypothetical protein MKW98_001861 [Papaver atlanticum]
MIVGYVQCGAKEVALEIFYKMPYKDIVSWNALLAVLNQCSYSNEALSIFLDMLRGNVRPNKLTLVSMLSACANAGAFDLGQWIHAYIDRNNIETDNHLLSSLIDMYAKCGSIEIAVELFAKVQNKDLLTWSIMIRGLAMNGHGNLSLDLFEEMLQFGVEPDSITFIGVLSACSHAGLVDKGRHYFDMMTRLYKISPEAEHYSCMGVAKLPGCSCIELNGVVQEFFAGDISHPQCEQIYRILEELERHMGSIDRIQNHNVAGEVRLCLPKASSPLSSPPVYEAAEGSIMNWMNVQ